MLALAGLGVAVGFRGGDATRIESPIVTVSGIKCGAAVRGGGALVAPDLVLMSGHVARRMPEVTVTFEGGFSTEGRVIHIDRFDDIAVVEIDAVNIPPVTLGDAREGDRGFVALVDAEGRAERVPYAVVRRIVGQTAAVGGEYEVGRRTLEIAAEVELGDSGAVLLAESGEAVGVVWAVSTSTDARAYATRGDEIAGVIADARSAPSGPITCRQS